MPRRTLQYLGSSLPGFSERADQRLVQTALHQAPQDTASLANQNVAARGGNIGLAILSANLGNFVTEARDLVYNVGSDLLQGRFFEQLPGARRHPFTPDMLVQDIPLLPRFPGRTNDANALRERMLEEFASFYTWHASAWLSSMHGSVNRPSMFSDFYKNINPYQPAVRRLIRQSPAGRVKLLQKPGKAIKLTKTDNPGQKVLGHRLFNNKANFMNLSKGLGGNEQAEKFIVETMAKEIEQDMDLGIGENQYLEHPVTNMAHGARRLAQETLADLKAEEHEAALTIKKAYWALDPNLPGRWRPEFDRPQKAPELKDVLNRLFHG